MRTYVIWCVKIMEERHCYKVYGSSVCLRFTGRNKKEQDIERNQAHTSICKHLVF